jgi:hypothetical protein
MSAGTWLRDRSRRVTNRGGWHLGHALMRGCGRACRVASAVEDWWNTFLGCEGHAHGAILTGRTCTKWDFWSVIWFLCSLGWYFTTRHFSPHTNFLQSLRHICLSFGARHYRALCSMILSLILVDSWFVSLLGFWCIQMTMVWITQWTGALWIPRGFGLN